MLISLITALVEFCIFVYLFSLYVRCRDARILIASVMVLFLGLYQFSEYMLCNTAHADFWARFGFAVYSFIPAIAFNLFLSLSNKKKKQWTYVIPLVFAVIALFYPNFIVESVCRVFHVSVNSFVFRGSAFMLTMYLAYYAIASIGGVYVFSKSAVSTVHDCVKSRIATILLSLAPLLGVVFFILYNIKYSIVTGTVYLDVILSISVLLCVGTVLSFWIRRYRTFLNVALVFVLLTFLVDLALYILIVQFSYDFSSMWCHFAFLYSISCLLYVRTLVRRN